MAKQLPGMAKELAKLHAFGVEGNHHDGEGEDLFTVMEIMGAKGPHLTFFAVPCCFNKGFCGGHTEAEKLFDQFLERCNPPGVITGCMEKRRQPGMMMEAD